MSWWTKWLNTPTVEGVGHASYPPCSRFQISVQGRVFYPFGRVRMVQGPLHEDARSSHSINVEGEVVTPKINVWASSPVSCPQSYELAISRMKRGGVELLQPVISYKPHHCDLYLHCQNVKIDSLTALVPLHWTFHPCSNRATPENILSTAQSFLFIQPRGVSAVCNWASRRHSTLCGTFSVSLLSGVCSSKVVVPHPAHSAHMTMQRGVPLAGMMRKVGFSGGVMSILSAGSSQGTRGTIRNLAFYFIWFLFPLVLHFPLPLLGISFSQDKVACFKQNSISLSVIVPLLSLNLRHGLCLDFLEGFS